MLDLSHFFLFFSRVWLCRGDRELLEDYFSWKCWKKLVKSVNFLVVVVMVEFGGIFSIFFVFFCVCVVSEWVSEASSERILWIVKEMRKFLRRESGRRKISWKNIGEKKKWLHDILFCCEIFDDFFILSVIIDEVLIVRVGFLWNYWKICWMWGGEPAATIQGVL